MPRFLYFGNGKSLLGTLAFNLSTLEKEHLLIL